MWTLDVLVHRSVSLSTYARLAHSQGSCKLEIIPIINITAAYNHSDTGKVFIIGLNRLSIIGEQNTALGSMLKTVPLLQQHNSGQYPNAPFSKLHTIKILL